MGAQSMHDFVVEIDVSGTPTNINSGTTTANVNVKRNIGQHFTFASDFAQTTEGGLSGDASLGVRVDQAAASPHGYLRAWLFAGGKRTLSQYVPDTSPGSLKVSGEASLESLSPLLNGQAGSGEVQVATAHLIFDGTIVESVVT